MLKKHSRMVTIISVVIFLMASAVVFNLILNQGKAEVAQAATTWQVNGSNLWCDNTVKVGIGTNVPNNILEVKSATPVININGTTNTGFSGLSFQTNGEENGLIKMKTQTGELKIQSGMTSTWGGFQTFYTAGAERMRIANTGKVGVGLTNPASTLQVKGEFSIFDRPDNQNYRYVFLPETTADGPGGRLRIGYKSVDGSFISDIMSFIWKGWVGVGTTDPQAKLDVYGSNNNNVFTVRSDSGQVKILPWKVDGNGDANYLESGNAGWTASRTLFFTGYNGSAGNFSFKGNVGIGTNVPNGLLEVKSAAPAININGTDGASLHGVSFQTNGEQTAMIKTKSSDGELRVQTGMSPDWGGFQTFYTNNLERMRILANGNIGIGITNPDMKLTVAGKVGASQGFSCSSDIRLKENIQPIKNSLAKILSLEGVSFDWKSDPAKQPQLGVIAQEVEKVAPELVSTNSAGYKSVNYDGFSALLINAVKEQQQSIDQLKAENQQLKDRLEKLEVKFNQ